MKTRTITVDDVCKLIESCKTSGVLTLKWGTVHLVFRDRKVVAQATPETAPTAAIPEEVLETQEKEELATQRNAKLSLLEGEFSELLLEDPAEYERAVASGELNEVTQT